MAAAEETVHDPFVEIVAEEPAERLLTATASMPPSLPLANGVSVADLVAFDLEDRPVIRFHHAQHGERLPARTTIALQCSQIGCQVVVMCESADPRLPIIVGVLQDRIRQDAAPLAHEVPQLVEPVGVAQDP